MEISPLLIRVVFLAFPGVIATWLYRKLRGRPARKAWEEFAEVLFFAVASYLVVYFAGLAWSKLPHCGERQPVSAVSQSGPIAATSQGSLATSRESEKDNQPLWIIDAFLDEKLPLQWGAVAWASVAAVVLASLASIAHHQGWLFRLAGRAGFSHRSGHDDIWEYMLSLPALSWIFVRDHKLNLVYFGQLSAYSDAGLDRELILAKVLVYSNISPGPPLYEVDLLYISRSNGDLSIEVPAGVLSKPVTSKPKVNHVRSGETERRHEEKRP